MISHRVIFLSLLGAIGVISASLCAPALPHIGDRFAASFSYLQFTISLFLLGNAFGQFFSGPLADKFGMKPILWAGLSLYICASSLCALAEQMNILLLGRFFQGVGTSVGPVLSRAIITKNYPSNKSAQIQSYATIGIGCASIFSILASGRLTLISWKSNFWLACVLGIVLFLWSFYALKNWSAHKPSSHSFKTIQKVIVHPLFFKNALCHALSYGLMYGYIGLFPFIMMELFHEKNPSQVGLYSAYMIIVYMAGAYLASKMATKENSARLILGAIILQMGSGLVLLFSTLSGFFIFNFSLGMILPLTIARSLSPFTTYATGTASSTLGLTYRLLGSFISFAITQMPLARGHNLGYAVIVLSIIGVTVLMLPTSSREYAIPK